MARGLTERAAKAVDIISDSSSTARGGQKMVLATRGAAQGSLLLVSVKGADIVDLGTLLQHPKTRNTRN